MTQTSKGWFFFVHEDCFELENTPVLSFFSLLHIKTHLYSSATFFFLSFVVILAERKWLKACKLLRSAGCLLDMT